ncbi:hypothetical protein Tco_0956459 [Tanacetum coccineum]
MSQKASQLTQGDSDDNNDDDDPQSDDEQSVSDNPRTSDDEEETQQDEYVHTPEDYVPTDDETNDVDDEEYDRINKEMYDDVNVELKDHEEVNQEVVGDQVNDDAQTIVTAASATQKTEVIPKSSTALATTIPLPILPFILIPQLSTPIPTPTTIEATISTTSAPDSTTLTQTRTILKIHSEFIDVGNDPKTRGVILTAIHQRIFDLENEVKTLRNVDHSLAIRATIKFEVPTVVKEYLGTSIDDTLHKHKALYHALMESILKDEDAMDKGVADKSKKRKPDDADKDEGPLA